MSDSQIFKVKSIGSPGFKSPIFQGEFTHFTSNERRMWWKPRIDLGQRSEVATVENSFEVAGPRSHLFFEGSLVRAGIVTCGGLCPGLNAVIRALVLQLWHRYGVRNITGFRYGYGGLGETPIEKPLMLTPDVVVNIHQQGGTLLGSSRGTPPTEEIADTLARSNIDMLFVIGGDGSMRGAEALVKELEKRKLPIAIIGIPKTIDNDIPFVRRSFGFHSAVASASDAMLAAHEEARGAKNGVGLVKLMGRNSGYIAANVTIATGHVNFCLVPEVEFSLEGANGLLSALERRLKEAGHAVIVAAEGAGQNFFQGKSKKLDASGNEKLFDIGLYLQEKITTHFKSRLDHFTLKYIDPSYIIRSTPPTPQDVVFSSRLAQNAVHAAMAGKTGVLIGYWHGEMTHVPFGALRNRTQTIDPNGDQWFNVLESTGQPLNLL